MKATRSWPHGKLVLEYRVYRSIPFSGFLSFFALSAISGNLSINRPVHFNMQRAILLDVALFVAILIASPSALGYSIPPKLGELSRLLSLKQRWFPSRFIRRVTTNRRDFVHHPLVPVQHRFLLRRRLRRFSQRGHQTWLQTPVLPKP
jgi:hypothetical protein